MKTVAEKTVTQQILEQVSSLTLSLANHVAGQVHTDQMTASMFKTLITGNGTPPLQEIVRRHEVWIAKHDECLEQTQKEVQEEKMIEKSDVRSDRREAVTANKQFLIMLCSQLIGFILLGLAIALRWR
jgi:hypothetical protein